MRKHSTRSVLAALAALPFAALNSCSDAGMLSAAADDVQDTDDDTDEPAPAPESRNGGVAASLPAEPCDHEAEGSFDVAPPDADDAVSPVLVRLLLEGGRPPAAEIRVPEFVNYYQSDVTPVADAAIHLFAAVTELGGDAFGIEVVIAAGTSFAERSLNLVLAVDTSDAMAGTRIARLRQCCVALAGALRAGDVVAISSLDPDAGTLFAPTPVSGPSDPDLIAHCNGIGITGQGQLASGLEAAYGLADQSRDGARVNRVVVFTGGALEPTLDAVEIAADAAGGGPFEQVVLTGVGIADLAAAAPYERAALDALTAAGEGAHLLIDSADEAAAVFGNGLAALVDVAVLSPAVRITLPPTLAIEALDGEPLDALSGEGAFRLAPGRAVAIRAEATSCDTAFLDGAAPVRVAASAVDPATDELLSATLESPLDELRAASSGPSKRDAVVAYALALDAWGSRSVTEARDAAIAARLTALAAAGAHPEDPDLAEIVALLDLHLASF